MAGNDLRKLTPGSLTRFRWTEGFWKGRTGVNRRATVPGCFQKLRETGRIDNWRLRWKLGQEKPHFFWDSDCAKWIESAAYCLRARRDRNLEKQVDALVDLIAAAQEPDGYLNPYFTVVEPDRRWTNLMYMHELYCAGHLIEAAVAYAEATGKMKFLEVIRRYADHIDHVFGSARGQIRGYDGHPEIELALVRLADATGDRRYLDLARFFIDERGVQPHFFDIEEKKMKRSTAWDNGPSTLTVYRTLQADKPVRDQKNAVGHSVRACYLYAGMADVASRTGDRELLAACRRLWRSIIERRMYITGGIGSSRFAEEFTFDYDLPNEEAYAETCASISLVFFAHRMLQIEAESTYADVMERTLVNGVLSGVSLDGKRFFYDNLLTVHPERYLYSRQKPPFRQEWFGCACCPPNLARLLASLGQYVTSSAPGALYVHLYGACETTLEVDGTSVGISQVTGYPWTGRVGISIAPKKPAMFAVCLRIPGWCRKYRILLNGRSVRKLEVRKGYACLKRTWKPGDSVEIDMEMPVERIEAHPSVRENCGMIALQRGPVVYCLESVDNGRDLADLSLPDGAALKVANRNIAGLRIPVIEGKGSRRERRGWSGALYRPDTSGQRAVSIRAVPYFLWNNRDKSGEMRVWLRRG